MQILNWKGLKVLFKPIQFSSSIGQPLTSITINSPTRSLMQAGKGSMWCLYAFGCLDYRRICGTQRASGTLVIVLGYSWRQSIGLKNPKICPSLKFWLASIHKKAFVKPLTLAEVISGFRSLTMKGFRLGANTAINMGYSPPLHSPLQKITNARGYKEEDEYGSSVRFGGELKGWGDGTQGAGYKYGGPAFLWDVGLWVVGTRLVRWWSMSSPVAHPPSSPSVLPIISSLVISLSSMGYD